MWATLNIITRKPLPKNLLKLSYDGSAVPVANDPMTFNKCRKQRNLLNDFHQLFLLF
jgi:hypothetical protein